MPRALFVVIAAVLAACVAAGFAAERWTRAHEPAEERAEALESAGKIDGAERIYWQLLERGPVTVPALVAFLDAHEEAVRRASTLEVADDEDDARTGVAATPLRVAPPPAIDEPQIDALLARPDLPPDVALLGRWWRGVARGNRSSDAQRDVVARADAEPPAAWANHFLARDLFNHARVEDACERYLREATHFPERAEDADVAIGLWADFDEWDRVEAALADPRVRAAADPVLQLRAALKVRDWGRAARVFPRTLRPTLTPGPVFLAVIAALAWGAFCARLGHLRARLGLRLPLYVAAFALGVASVSMTLALVAVEEELLAMHETQVPLRDFLYFTFGVGLREEISKLVFFLPLLPVVRRRGTRLDVLVCGALVGLGFAAAENLRYFHMGDLSTAMARFLTANFFHMSMTAILAGALDEMMREREGSFVFSQRLILVAAMHGVYDFCLSSRAYGDLSFFAMIVFVLLTRQFLTSVSWARAKERAADARLLETFALGMSVVVGASFVYASALVGPGAAAKALGQGLLGLGIILFVFVRELRRV
jgi:RsiW-degrading membrane proteinase PrsW (M82 family)